MDTKLAVVAGTVSTLIFVLSTLPMLAKAYRTKDLASYSVGNIALANAGNLVHSAYVFSLPAGPIWALHGFYLVSTGLMLFWYLRYEGLGSRREQRSRASSVPSAMPDRSPTPESYPVRIPHSGNA